MISSISGLLLKIIEKSIIRQIKTAIKKNVKRHNSINASASFCKNTERMDSDIHK